MNRRDFLGGAVSGAVVTVGAGMAFKAVPRQPPLVPPPAPPPSAPALPEHARLSFSQQGEDIVLFHTLRDLLKIEQATYVDVGAADPALGSNTYLLYTAGSRGVLVEPNPMYVKRLQSARPLDQVVAAGIGVTDAAEGDYYEIKGDPTRNTFSAKYVAELQKGKTESVIERVVKMPLVNINRVIETRLGGRAPDLLSTDVEGLDYAIIRSLDLSRFRPGVICAETVPVYKRGIVSDITMYLRRRDYIPRGGSMFNTIFVDARRIDA